MRTHGDPAPVGKLDRVADEIGEDLADPIAIAFDFELVPRAHFGVEAQGFCFRSDSQLVNGLGHEPPGLLGAAFDRELLGLNAGDIEEVANQAAHVVPGAPNHFDRPAKLSWILFLDRPSEDAPGAHDDGRQAIYEIV